MADANKTEKATPKRRRDERKKGNVFLSKDAVAVATLVGSFFTFGLLAGGAAERLMRYMAFCLELGSRPGQSIENVLSSVTVQAMLVLLKIVGPVIGVTILCSVAATFAQTKFLVSGEALKPKFSRISPIQGFKRLFSLKSVIEAIKGILKISLLMVIVFFSLRDMVQNSSRYLHTDVQAAGAHLFSVAGGMAMRIVIAFIALAALDFLYQWWEYERQIKMSKQEIKDEHKQIEGDPQVKGKIREIQRRRTQMRMMQQVPQADVVIRNPTHFAVALRYKPERDAAPIVLAKGQDELAQRIVRKAEEHKITVIENVPLARALYAQAEINREIPPELYTAVAEVLVYIFKLNEAQEIVK